MLPNSSEALPRVERRIAPPPAPALAALSLVAAVCWVVATQRYSPVAGVVAAVSTAVLIASWDALRSRRVAALTLVLNVAILLLYFWSWDESHAVTIRVSNGSLTAQVDGDVLSTRIAIPAGRVGLQEAPYATYRVQATGEAIQSDDTSAIGRLARAFRLAQPAPAWSSIRVTGEARPGASRLIPAGPSPLDRNGRGEWTGSESEYSFFNPPLVPPYILHLKLIRPEGAQNVLLGVGSDGTGYALQIRWDQPDMLLATWRDGIASATSAGTSLREMDFIAEIQRVLRTVLPGYLFSVVVLALAVGLYPVLLAIFETIGASEGDDLDELRGFLRRPVISRGFPIAIAVIAVIATGTVSTALLDRMPHVQDSVAYLFQAKIFLTGHLSAPAPPAVLRPFFVEEYMPYFGDKWFSQYPPGHPFMLLLGLLAGAPWLVEPLLASLTLAIVFLLGRRVYGTGTGMLAATLGLSSPFWLFLGSSFMAHATGLFFGAVCFLCFALAEDTGNRRWVLFLGASAAGLFLTRQITAVGLLAPLALYALFLSRRGWRAYLPALVPFALIAGLLLVYNWAQMGNPLQSTYAAWSPTYKLGFGPNYSPGGAFTPADGIWNAYQNLSMLSAQLYGWPYGVAFGLVAVPFVLGRATRWDVLLLASFASLVVIHMFYWCPCLMFGPRFYYEGLPCLFLLSARGVYELFQLPLRVWHSRLIHDETVAAFAPALLVSALLVFNFRFYLPAQIGLYKDYNYSSDAELRAVRNAGLHHAVVFVVSNPSGFWASYGNVFFANAPDLSGDIVYAHDLGTADRVLFRYFPGRTYYRLNGTSLTRLS